MVKIGFSAGFCLLGLIGYASIFKYGTNAITVSVAIVWSFFWIPLTIDIIFSD